MSKIPAPNYTQSPNILFDETFKTLKEGELRIILVLMRQTFGWHKAFDRISLSQLADKSGMERTSVARSMNSLIEKGLVIKKKFGEKGKEKCYFSLVIEEVEKDKIDDDGDISEEEMDLISNNLYQSPKDTTPVSQRDYPSLLKTPTKETLQKKESKENLSSLPFSSSDQILLPDPLGSEETPTAVVVDLFDDLKIPEKLKNKIMRQYKSDEIKIAVRRCKEWEGRSNDSAGILTTLKDSNNWNDVQKTDDPEKNKEKAIEILKKYEINKNILTINILNGIIEFIDGSMRPICIWLADYGFIEQLENTIEKMIFKNLMRKHKL